MAKRSRGKTMIKAQAWSDCQQKRVEFDATLWAEQASDNDITELVQCGFRCDYAADNVVLFMADHDKKVAELFQFLDIVRRQPYNGDTNGFECSVDEDDFRSWLKENKPTLIQEGDTE